MARERGCGLDEIKDTVSHVEYLEWLALQTVDPTGEWRADYRAAVIVATIRSILSDKPIGAGEIMQAYFAFDEAQTPTRRSPAEMERDFLKWAKSTQRRGKRSK